MKKQFVVYLMVLVLVTLACSNNGEDPIAENTAPEKVSNLLFPTNNLLCTDYMVNFQWEATSDPNGDAVSYNLQIARHASFSQIEASYHVATTSKSVALPKGVLFYWRVQAVDSKNLGGDFSETFQFYTEGEGQFNHLPFAPTLISPSNGQEITGNVKLRWEANDADNDNLQYTVYVDSVNPPVEVVANAITNTFLDLNLSPNTAYYWKIAVNDGNGGVTIGQVWNFTTN